jgi:peptide chain release factor 1
MWKKLLEIETRFAELEARLAEPETSTDPKVMRETMKAMSDIEEVVRVFREAKRTKRELAEARDLAASTPPADEMHLMAEDEANRLRAEEERFDEELKVLLLPKDANDAKNVILEIRAGAGGEEAALFASELFRMYSRYAETKKWKVDVIERDDTGLGGMKNVACIIEGERVYSRLKYEGGVHRVQRVPATEASGRIHTSAVTVAVLPEAEDVDIDLNMTEIRVDTFCASGPGGQGVNTTYSAVRLTHLPTNTVVSCQDERSQIKNKAKAMRVLKSRLLEVERERQDAANSAERKKMVGSGDRSEKIRTYNYPQSRVTDHRIGLTTHRLQEVLDGRLDELVEPLVAHFQAEKLRESVVAK